MNSRERFLKACRKEPVDRPPVWVMRQAGRHLPEYLALKEKHSFHEMVQTPKLAAEVTMQPIRRYGMDAAILFSDILVIPEALGQPYHFRDIGGIEMEFALDSAEAIDNLDDPSLVPEKLDYVARAIHELRSQLGEDRAIIGFGGAPWTLATYMIEGQSSKTYRRSRELFYTDRPMFDALMERITEGLVAYFKMQIEAGVDVIQIFDSWAGVLSPDAFEEASLIWIRRIVNAIKDDVPVIVFCKQMHDHLGPLVETGANILGIGWTADLAAISKQLPADVGVQGNLDPVLMNTTPEIVEREATKLLESMRGQDGWIVNLGHGIMPQAKIECMTTLAETVRSFS